MSLNTITRIHNKGGYRYEEHVAHEAITPGMLLKINEDNEVAKHATSTGVHEKLFALEDALQGSEVSHDYEAAEIVCCLIGESGTVVNALLSSGTAYVVGDYVASNADGTLFKSSTNPVGVIEDEDCDLTVSGAVDTLHPVRLL